MQEQGTISVNTENIFPIIKKFLYSDHEIFLRELVSNAIDATQKIKQLASLGEYSGELGELKVSVQINAEAGTITISDKGIGMTAEEIKKYINQVAFSGATEFVEKYKDKTDGQQQIIGHFGLGFYSAFMVAEQVKIITLSHQADAEAAQWTCDGSTSFSIEKTVKKERGTDIVLHIAEDSKEFLDKHRLREILMKYCRFLPIPIELEGEVINQTDPIWTKAPADLKDEDYQNFYKALYPLAEEPLFWIHLNVDYPFNLTGILYFPKINNNLDIQREKIQLYSRQVFITDEVKEIVPQFLTLLHGVIDSPDIPLNVSRSFLQADGNVKKINGYITRKVADKLTEIFNQDRKAFEEKWESIGLFVKYGYVTEDKFAEKAQQFCLLQNVEGKFYTFEEYRNLVQANQVDKNDNTIWLYTSDAGKQNAYIQAAQKRQFDVLKLDNPFIDNHFISTLERKLEKTVLKRVDAETTEKLIDKGENKESVLSQEEQEQLKNIFTTTLANDKLTIQVEAMLPDEMPVVITLSEHLRRMNEMAAAQGFTRFMNPLSAQMSVSLNGNHALNRKILATTDPATQQALVKQTYDLALLAHGMLEGASLTDFLQRSVQFLG